MNTNLKSQISNLKHESTEKSSRSRPRVRQSARGRASEQAFFRGVKHGSSNLQPFDYAQDRLSTSNFQPLAIALILAAFFALGTTYSIITPLFEAPDELQHYARTKRLAEAIGLIQLDPAVSQFAHQERYQQPLYHLVGALATFWDDAGDMSKLLWFNPHADIGVAKEDGNVNLLVHTSAESFPYRGTSLGVHALRLLSVLMGAGTVLMTYLIALQISPQRQHLALGAAAINAFIPQFLFISGAVNNDNLVTILSSLVLWLLIPLVETPISIRRSILIGVIIGLATLTKVNSLGLLPLVVLVIAISSHRQHSTVGRRPPDRALFHLGRRPSANESCRQRSTVGRWSPDRALFRFRRRPSANESCRQHTVKFFVSRVALLLAIVALVSGWKFVRNWQLYGDPTALQMFLNTLAPRHPQPTLHQFMAEWGDYAQSLWGLFGLGNVPLGSPASRILDILALLGALGALIFLVITWRRRQASDRAWIKVLILLAWLVILFGSLMTWVIRIATSIGRFLFPAISSISILLFLGLSQFVPRRHTKALVCLIGGLMFVIAAITPFRYIAPAYAKPSLLSAEEIEAIPNRLDISFGGTMKLLGYSIPISNTQYPVSSALMPGDSFTITLYWQSLAEMNQNYSTFVHLLDETELIVAQRDMYPGQGLYPTSLWSVGDTIANRYVLRLPETAFAPNQAQLEVGLYNFATGERLLAYGPNGEPLGDNARFHEINIGPRAGAEAPNPVNFNFGNRIALIGYDMDRRSASPGETIHLTLYWRTLTEMEEDYVVFAHLLRKEDQIWARADGEPLDGAVPTSAWRLGQTFEDRYGLTIGPDAPAGAYEIEVGLYLPQAGKRLAILSPDGRLLGDRILLSKVRIH